MVDWQPLLTLLENQKALLPLTVDGQANEEATKDKLEKARTKYVADMKSEINKLKNREKDDQKEAVKIAVDASKTFVQIAIAFVVATIGFFQFSYQTASWPVFLILGGAALLALGSMWSGFNVISTAYKRGEGRKAPD